MCCEGGGEFTKKDQSRVLRRYKGSKGAPSPTAHLYIRIRVKCPVCLVQDFIQKTKKYKKNYITILKVRKIKISKRIFYRVGKQELQ